MTVFDRLRHRRRVKTPTVLQMEAVECGPASLAIILQYFGRFVPLEQLRVSCGVSRDGSKASNLLKVARQYGLTAKGFKKGLEPLKTLRAPMIVFWNFHHFLVVEGFSRRKVYLNDPATGPRTLSWEAFDEGFTGVVLTFEQGPDFEPGGPRPSLIAALRNRLAGSELAVGYAILAGLALVVPGLVIPVFSKVFIDELLVKEMHDWLRPLLLGMGLTAILRGIMTWLQAYYLLRLETKLSVSTSVQFLAYVLRLPISFFHQRYTGEITSRVQLNDRVAELLSGDLATAVIGTAMLTFYALLMFSYDVTLTLIGIAVVSMNILGLRMVSRHRTDLNQHLQQETGKLTGMAMSGLAQIETLKAGGAESDFFAKWAGHYAKTVNDQQRLRLYTFALALLPPFLSSLNVIAILCLGALRVIDGQMTMGELVAFQSLMASFVAPVTDLVNMGATLQEVDSNIKRLDDVLHHEPDYHFTALAASVSAPHTEGKLHGALSIDRLSYGYSRLDPPLIDGFCLELKPGSWVALVGGSGSGKSTIARLVCGLYEPWSGGIWFDGQLRTAIPRPVLNNSLALVDQEIFVFEGTVRDNIILWDTTLPESRLIEALQDACIHQEIIARAGGYDAIIEEGGRNFSGGQLQRLEIARALAVNPSLLVLDEATSSLDPLTEKMVIDNIRRRGCTCLVVAHRLSTIRDCDEIIVLDRGKVVQRGTHSTMIQESEGRYAQLIAHGLG